MKPGQTLVGPDGLQVCLYPMTQLSLSQLWGTSTVSHCCGCPFDNMGVTGNHDILYAPCDCHVIETMPPENGNWAIFVSDNPVHTPSGIGVVTFQFTHGDLLGNGSTYKQGEPIYTTGTYGLQAGDHCHIDQSLVPNDYFKDWVYSCAFGNRCYSLANSCDPTLFWYVNDTPIIQTLGLKFQTYQGGSQGSIGGGGDGPKLEWIIPVMETNPATTSRQLSEAEALNNAKCFYGYMHITYGWTLEAVCGVLGNMWWESSVNPNRWQGDNINSNVAEYEGFGLVQWTPYAKVTDWMKERGAWGNYSTYGNVECDRLALEMQGQIEAWYSTSTYPMSCTDFTQSTQAPSYLAMVFLYNYERPKDYNQPFRATTATEYYNQLKSWTPVLPGQNQGGTAPGQNKKKQFWLFMPNKRRIHAKRRRFI